MADKLPLFTPVCFGEGGRGWIANPPGEAVVPMDNPTDYVWVQYYEPIKLEMQGYEYWWSHAPSKVVEHVGAWFRRAELTIDPDPPTTWKPL